jgi:hypothetical protein
MRTYAFYGVVSVFLAVLPVLHVCVLRLHMAAYAQCWLCNSAYVQDYELGSIIGHPIHAFANAATVAARHARREASLRPLSYSVLWLVLLLHSYHRHWTY